MMKYQKLFQQIIYLNLVIILLAGCGGSAPKSVSEASAATVAPEQAATTPVPGSATSTPTLEPPTATLTIDSTLTEGRLDARSLSIKLGQDEIFFSTTALNFFSHGIIDGW